MDLPLTANLGRRTGITCCHSSDAGRESSAGGGEGGRASELGNGGTEHLD